MGEESQMIFGILLYSNMDAFWLVNKNTCGVPAAHHISYCMWLYVTITLIQVEKPTIAPHL